MKYSIVILLSFFFSQCHLGKETGISAIENNAELPVVKTYEELKANKDKNAMVFGTLIQKEFVNKGGRATGVYETWVQLSDGELVNLRNKGENKYDYEKLKNKKVKLEAVIFYGGIDSDNPEHQSRIGYRIDYTVLTVID